jgi:hypothetical protein
MGSMTARKGADGKLNYRATIRINIGRAFLIFQKIKAFIQKHGAKTGLRNERWKFKNILIFCLAKKS